MSEPAHPTRMEGEAFLRALFESAIDGIVVIDRRGIVQDLNPAVCRLFGYERDELLGRNVNVLMPEPDRSRHDGYLRHHLDTGEKRIIGIGREVEGLTRDGRLIPLRLSVNKFHVEGEPCFTGFLHDISAIKEAERRWMDLHNQLERKVLERTEELSDTVDRLLAVNRELQDEVARRKRIAAELRKTQQELEQALEKEMELGELKSRFLTMASHEFRTPLATILSSVNLTARYETAEQQPRRMRHIERIRAMVRSLTGILDDFLSVGRLQEGRVKPRVERVDLVPALREWTEIFAEGVDKEGRLEVAEAPGELNVQTDPAIVHQLLLNLLSNAAKYSQPPIDVAVRLFDRGDAFVLEVEDHGIGIPADEQVHLFTRFFRAPNVQNIPGTGLGLHIVRQYADLLHGELSFESEEGKGTIFRVAFPKEPPV